MKPRALNLALTASPGAYVWGVLDALLADARIEIGGISAAGMGAVCAALTAATIDRGPLAARQELAEFWYEVAHGDWPVPVVPPSRLGELDFDNVASPFAAIPAHPLQPLDELLRRRLDFQVLRRAPWPLFVAATDIASGRLCVFRGEELTPERLLASVASPFCAPPVQVDGRHYWGGGLGGDPPIYPLLYESACDDLLLVTRRPPDAAEVPDGSVATFGRIRDLSARQALDAELRSIGFVQRLMAQGRLDTREYRPKRLHRITMSGDFEAASGRPDLPQALLEMHACGVADAARWLAGSLRDLGRRSTFDIGAGLMETG